MNARLAQIIVKVLNLGIAGLAGHFGTQLASGQINSISEPIATGLVSAILLGFDIYMHRHTGTAEQK